MKQFIHKQLLLLVAVLSATITASAYVEVDGIYYTIDEDDKTCSVTNPNGLSNNGPYAGTINIPSTVNYDNTTYTVISIEWNAFYNCYNLTSVTIPNSVRSIGRSAFYGCSRLTSVTIPNSVRSIGSSAFYGCSRLTSSVTIPNSVTSIEEETFYDCSNLTSVTIPNSVTSIGSSAFYGCSRLTSVTIPNSVTSIGEKAFYNCNGLTSVTIGTGITYIGNNAFSYNRKPIPIKKAIWLSNTPPVGYSEIHAARNYVANYSYSDLDNVAVYPFLGSMFEEGGIKYVPVSPSDRTCDAIDCMYDGSAENIVINKTVNHQGISMSLQNVNDYLCYRNDSIKTVTIKDFKSDIGDYAFYSCTGIESVDIQALTGNIGDYALSYCDDIESVNIQGLAGNIGDNAFYYCPGIKTVNIQGAGNIGVEAFSNCDGIESVDIQSLTGNIGDYAFYFCSNLKGIDIPNTVTSIGRKCFLSCNSLACANIGSGISVLPRDCFGGCGLTEIKIPQTVNSIDDNVFDGCRSLTNVYIEDRQTELVLGSNGSDPLFSDCPLDSVYIGGNISYETGSEDGYSPFYRNTSLRAVKITNRETEISTNEFYGCTNLQCVELGNGIESIGDYAFSGCSAIESFTFGNSLQTIGEEAFSDCTAMTQLISHTVVPPTCGTQALDDINKWNCKLLVPEKSIDAYKAADQWKEFFFVESSGEDILITSIELMPEETTIGLNETLQLTAIVMPEDATYKNDLLYESSDETIATVDANGLVTSKDVEGAVTITATTQDGTDLSAICVITVVKPSGIDDVDANSCSVWAEGGKLVFSGFPSGSQVRIYTLAGQLLYSGEMECCPNLSAGFYFVEINGSTYKILVR